MANSIWVFAEAREGKVKKVAFEMLTAAKMMADKAGSDVAAVVIGSGAGECAASLGHYGAQKVFVCDSELLAEYSPEGYTKAIGDLAKEYGPAVLLGGATTLGKDLFPRLAAHLDTGLASDCTGLDMDESGLLKVVRPIYAGKLIVSATIPEGRPQMATIRPNVLEMSAPDESLTAEVVNVAVNISGDDIRAKIREIVKGASVRVDLTEANIIVSGGRAMKDEEGFKILWDLADALGEGASVGASRAAVDSGFATHDMQVGQTGKVVNPTLYVACGISGAIQHLAGMRTSKVIVAINKDADAPIFQKADYGIVGDLFKVVPIMTEEVKKLKASD